MSTVAQDGARPGWQKITSPRFVGRVRELDVVVSALRPMAVAVVVVEGEAGVGKTRLVAEVRARAEVAQRRFVVGACRRIREPFPLGPVIEAVRGLGDVLAKAELSPLAGALRPLLPELTENLPRAPEPLDDRIAERYRVFRALAEVLGSVGPVVVVLEDLHWADEQTLDFLTYLLGDMPPMVSALLTFRSEEAPAAVRALTATVPASIARAHVVLAPMDAQQTAALAAAILGLDHVSEEFAGYLCDRASGLPFAIEELLALLQARGKLIRRDGYWARRDLDELDVPTGIRNPVLERVEHLSDDARAVVEAAAVLQTTVPARALVSTCLVPKTRARRGLEAALESGLLAEHDELVGFRHVLAAQAVEGAVPGPRRRQLHARAASALGELWPVPLGQRAHHLRHAGRLDEWVLAAELAADQATALRHDAEAVRLLKDVVRHGPLSPQERGRLAVKLGWAALETVRTGEVVDLLREVLDNGLDEGTAPSVRGELRFLLGWALNVAGTDPAVQRELFVTALDELTGRPDLRVRAMVSVGLLSTSGETIAQRRAWLTRAVELLPDVHDPTVGVFVLGKVGMGLVTMGDPGWRQVLDCIESATQGRPQSRAEVNAYYSVGVQCCYVGQHDVGHRLLTSALDGAVACENRRLQLLIRSALTVLRYFRGTWDALADDADHLLDALADFPLGRIDAELALGSLSLAHGALDDAHRRLESARQLAEDLGVYEALAFPADALARIALARGDTDAAVTATQRCLAVLRDLGAWAAAAPLLPTATEALVAAERTSDAGALLADHVRALRDLDVAIAVPALHHARGLLDAASGDASRAAGQLISAADGYERLPYPYQAARAREQAAFVLARDADRDAAAAELSTALGAYRRLGATWDHERAVGVARRRGLRLPGRRRTGRPGYGHDLSPREHQVAELAAAGRTNKEIAAELFLSVYTVEQHVTAVLRKLGIRSRAAIGTQLAGDGRSSAHS